jgi:hypothetical protein
MIKSLKGYLGLVNRFKAVFELDSLNDRHGILSSDAGLEAGLFQGSEETFQVELDGAAIHRAG